MPPTGTDKPTPQPSPEGNRTAARALVTTAAIAALLCVAVGAAMIFHHFRAQADDPLKAPQLAALKEQLASRPQDEALKQQIRELDLQVRRHHFQTLALTTTGGYLLVGGAVVFLLAARRLLTLKPKPRAQRPKLPDAAQTARAVTWMHVSVAVVSALLTAALLLLAFTTGTGLPTRLSDWEKQTTAAPSGAKAGPADFASNEEMRQNWPRFRGPDGNGVATQTNVPLIWDGKSGAGILWKAVVPAPGFNSPVVWGDRVFLSGGDKAKREVFCFSVKNGELLWQRPVQVQSAAVPADWEWPDQAGAAASSVATDGRRVYAIFANGDLAAFDLNGASVWSKNLGAPKNAYGHGSSLVAWQGRLIIQYDQGEAEERKSRLYALNGATGETVWEKPRPVPSSWATPIVINAAGKDQIITLAVPAVIAYAAADGAELWRVAGLNGEVTPSAVFAQGLVFVLSPSEKLMAIRPDGLGDVTKTHVAWAVEDTIPDITCPVSNGELVFLVTSGGMATCFDAKDGKKQWEKDLDTEFQASPSLVGNRLYCVGMKGVVVVLEASRQFKQLARAEMEDKFIASPAFAQNRIFLRGTNQLYCIGANAEPAAKP